MKTLLLPTDYISESSTFTLISIQHYPNDYDEDFLIAFQNETSNFFELQLIEKKHSCWIFETDQIIESDGNFYTFTKLDPLFFLAPCIQKCTQKQNTTDQYSFTPLSQIIYCLNNFFHFQFKSLFSPLFVHQLEHICEITDFDDEKLFRFSLSKYLSWLQRKYDHLNTFLLNTENEELLKSIQHSAQSVVFVKSIKQLEDQQNKSKIEQTARLAFALLCKYCSLQMLQLLLDQLKPTLSSSLLVELERIVKDEQQYANKINEKNVASNSPTTSSSVTSKQSKHSLFEAAFEKVSDTADEENKKRHRNESQENSQEESSKKRQKSLTNRSVESLKKMDVGGMKKMTDFFKKK